MTTSDVSSIPAEQRLVLARLGALLLDAGLSVTEVQSRVRRVAAATVATPVSVSVLPEDVFVVDVASGATTSCEATGVELSMRQTALANRLVERVVRGVDSFADVPRGIADIRGRVRWHPDLQWIVGTALISVGLAIVFRCPWWAIASSVVVGLVVGAGIVVIRRAPSSVAIVPFVMSFTSTALVGVIADVFHLGPLPIFAVCAPVAILVPGALITNALLELTATDVVTGASRLVYGVIMLGFMAAGIVTGARLTHSQLDENSAAKLSDAPGLIGDLGWQAIPPSWLSWVGVVFLALGIGAGFGAGFRLSSVSLAVMTGVYAALAVLAPLIGDVPATGVIAAVVFIASQSVERRTAEIPSIAFFFPAFLLLVPGTVGLVALTSTDEHGITVALSTFASLCIGVKVGELISAVRFRGYA